MKTLESIINSPERMLSNEEMKSLRGGDASCKCFWTDAETGEFIDYQNVEVTGGDCGTATFQLSSYYQDIFVIHCI